MMPRQDDEHQRRRRDDADPEYEQDVDTRPALKAEFLRRITDTVGYVVVDF